MRNLRNTKGFTLIELMIVVVIIGILAAIAIPKFSSVSKTAKEAEADPILKQAYSLQESYMLKNDEYADTDAKLQTVGWAPPTDSKYYTYSVKSGAAGAFCVEATPKGSVDVTTKSIKEDRIINMTGC